MSGTQDAMDRVVEERRLTGVRGLLLVPPVVVAMYMLVLTVGLMRMLLSGPIDTPEGLTMATMSGVLIGLGAFAIWTLMQERRIARTLMIVFFSISGVLSLLGFLTQLAMPGADPFDLIASVRGAAVATAAIGYFLRSLRVKLTLVN